MTEVWRLTIGDDSFQGSLTAMQRRAAAYLADKPVEARVLIKNEMGDGIWAIRRPNKRYRGKPDRPDTSYHAAARG